jgi:dihydroorotate dehydrogenase
MRDKIKTAKFKVKYHVMRHRAKYASAVTATAMMYAGYKLAERNREELDHYLEEHGLLEDYYAEMD